MGSFFSRKTAAGSAARHADAGQKADQTGKRGEPDTKEYQLVYLKSCSCFFCIETGCIESVESIPERWDYQVFDGGRTDLEARDETPVFSLADLLHLRDPGEIQHSSRIIVIKRPRREPVGIVVDYASDKVEFPAEEILPVDQVPARLERLVSYWKVVFQETLLEDLRKYVKGFHEDRKGSCSVILNTQGVLQDCNAILPKDIPSLTKIAGKGNAEAQYRLGLALDSESGGREKALYWFEQAARQDHPGAQYQLGNAYRHGLGAEKDPAKSFFWFEQAARQDYPGAQYELGVAYQFGWGTEEDYAKSAFWYKKAADHGHAEAQYSLGIAYWYGWGTEKDPAKSAFWYEKAANNGHIEAQYRLGKGYFHGEWGQCDYRKAVFWMDKALSHAESSDIVFDFDLDPERELQWARDFVRLEKDPGGLDAEAFARLGNYFNYNRTVSDSETRAFQFYRKAALLGNTDNLWDIGLDYYYGTGTEKDSVIGYYWLNRALEEGDDIAEIMIDSYECSTDEWQDYIDNQAVTLLICVGLDNCRSSEIQETQILIKVEDPGKVRIDEIRTLPFVREAQLHGGTMVLRMDDRHFRPVSIEVDRVIRKNLKEVAQLPFFASGPEKRTEECLSLCVLGESGNGNRKLAAAMVCVAGDRIAGNEFVSCPDPENIPDGAGAEKQGCAWRTEYRTEYRLYSLTAAPGGILGTQNAAVELAQSNGAILAVDTGAADASDAARRALCMARQAGIPWIVVFFDITEMKDENNLYDFIYDETLELLEMDVEDLLTEYDYEGCPVIKGSASLALSNTVGETGDRIMEMLQVIDRHMASPVGGTEPFSMNVGDVRTAPGGKTAVSGLVTGGRLSAGEKLEAVGFSDRPVPVEVQEVRLFDRPVEYAAPGDYLTVLLDSVPAGTVCRGQVLAAPGTRTAAGQIKVQAYLVPEDEGGSDDFSVCSEEMVFVIGTAVVEGIIIPISDRMVSPGDDFEASLKLHHPVPARQGMRLFGLRDEKIVLTAVIM